MPRDPDPPPAKRFKPGSPFSRLDKKQPGMLLPRAGHAPGGVDAQRKQLPIYQSRTQLINQLRQLHNAVFIGKTTYITRVTISYLSGSQHWSLRLPTCVFNQTHLIICSSVETQRHLIGVSEKGDIQFTLLYCALMGKCVLDPGTNQHYIHINKDKSKYSKPQ